MNSQVELQLLHQQKLIVQDDLGGPLLVTLNVGHELLHGDIELLHLAGQVDSSDQDLLRMIIHDRIVKVKPLEVVESRALYISGHGWLELLTELPHLDREVEHHVRLVLLRQEVPLVCSWWSLLHVTEKWVVRWNKL